MPDERRYTEDEIAALIKQAARAQEAARQQQARQEGLTLAEVQEAARAAGIDPAFVTRAAADLATDMPALPPRTLVGLPVSVTHEVLLPGAFTDADWDVLVADLRETFHATGRLRRDGALRQWRNGNLGVIVEPAAGGHRLRFRTLKGNAQPNLAGGGMMLGMGVLMVVMALLGLGSDPGLLSFGAIMALGGLGMAGATAYHLPRWADERRRQMERLGARAQRRAEAEHPAPAALQAPDASLEMPMEASPPEAEAPLAGARLRTRRN